MSSDSPTPRIPNRDQHGHGGNRPRPDDDAIEARTEAERVDAGLAPFDPDQVPAAEDGTPEADVTDSDQYQRERAEVQRELKDGQLEADQSLPKRDRPEFPPSDYDS